MITRVTSIMLKSKLWPGGGHVVVWSASSSLNEDTSGWGTYGQLYDANGDKVGDSFLLNEGQTSGTQIRPTVTALEDGGFVAAWESSDGNGTGIFARRFDANGDPVGDIIAVNSYSTSTQYQPSITTLDGGKFAITWSSYGQSGNSTYDVYLRIFNANGTPTTASDILVNTLTGDQQYTRGFTTESITTMESGRIVVTWTDYNSAVDSSRPGVMARIFEANGTPATDQFRMNTTTTSRQDYASLDALSGGGFVATWSDSSGLDGSGWGVISQRFDDEGNKVGGQQVVNTLFSSTQIYSTVQGLEDGGYVVVWQSYALQNN